MDQTTRHISIDKPSLLYLNDDCLREIFKFLHLKEYVNLADACQRLLGVAQQYKKYKNIAIKYSQKVSFNTEQEFFNVLSVIGKQVVSLNVCGETGSNFFTLRTIADKCTNLSSVVLMDDYNNTLLIPFHNLKELKVGHSSLSTKDWKNCFANNPGIENLEYRNTSDCSSDPTMSLLKMLPKLKDLKINNLAIQRGYDDLSCLTTLTKFSVTSDQRVPTVLLIELAEKLKLVELGLSKSSNIDAFVCLKSFLHLEVLSMECICSSLGAFQRVPDTTIFPTMLKKITLDGFKLSCSLLLSTIRQLKFLEELDMARGKILSDSNESETFPSIAPSTDIKGSEIISRIAEELELEKRKLKIIFAYQHDRYCLEDNQVCKYSDYLEIIIHRWTTSPSVSHGFDHTFEE